LIRASANRQNNQQLPWKQNSREFAPKKRSPICTQIGKWHSVCTITGVDRLCNEKREEMKKVIVALAFFLSIGIVTNAQKKYSFENLKGSWRNSSGAGLDIVDSNTIYIVYGTQKKLVTRSKADFSKSPVWLDLAVKDSIHVTTLKSLLLFVNEDLLQWQVFDSETRPAYFSTDKGDMLFLKRVPEMMN
jgi:hypothetical protein